MTIKENDLAGGFKPSNISAQDAKGKFTKETLKEENENLQNDQNFERRDDKQKSTVKMGKIGINKKKEDPSKNYYEAAGSSTSSGKFDVTFELIR